MRCLCNKGIIFLLQLGKLRLETKSFLGSCLVVFPQQLSRDTSEKDRGSGKGHMAVDNLCLLAQDWTQLVSCYLYMALGWCQLMSSQLRAQPERSVLFPPVFVGAAYLLCYDEI